MRRLASAIAVVVFLFGCGGGGGPTKSEFVAGADKVCARYDRPLASAKRAYDRAVRDKDLQAATGALDRVLRVGARQMRDLRAVTPPDSDKNKIAGYLQVADDQYGLIREMRDAMKAKDAARIQNAGARLNRYGNRFDPLARAYGFRTCGAKD